MGIRNAGNPAINRVSDVNAALTYIDLNNVASVAFVGDHLEVWTNTDMTNLKVGAFYQISGNTYKCRNITTIGSVSSGSKQVFDGLAVAFLAGDALGWYNDTGRIEKTNAGNMLYKSGDYATVGTEATYSTTANVLSMYIAQTKGSGTSAARAMIAGGFI